MVAPGIPGEIADDAMVLVTVTLVVREDQVRAAARANLPEARLDLRPLRGEVAVAELEEAQVEPGLAAGQALERELRFMPADFIGGEHYGRDAHIRACRPQCRQ